MEWKDLRLYVWLINKYVSVGNGENKLMLSQSQNNITFYQFTVFSLTVYNLNLLIETRGGSRTGPIEIFHIFSFNLDVGDSVFEFSPPPPFWIHFRTTIVYHVSIIFLYAH